MIFISASICFQSLFDHFCSICVSFKSGFQSNKCLRRLFLKILKKFGISNEINRKHSNPIKFSIANRFRFFFLYIIEFSFHSRSVCRRFSCSSEDRTNFNFEQFQRDIFSWSVRIWRMAAVITAWNSSWLVLSRTKYFSSIFI